MKKINLLLLAVLACIFSYAQQTTTSTDKDNETLLLGLVGGLSAAQTLNVQEIINHLVTIHTNKLATNEEIGQKINMQKNIIGVLGEQVDKVSASKMLNPETDQVFLDSFKTMLGSLTSELDLYLSYVKTNDANTKKQFDAKRTQVQKDIRVFLNIEQ